MLRLIMSLIVVEVVEGGNNDNGLDQEEECDGKEDDVGQGGIDITVGAHGYVQGVYGKVQRTRMQMYINDWV